MCKTELCERLKPNVLGARKGLEKNRMTDKGDDQGRETEIYNLIRSLVGTRKQEIDVNKVTTRVG